MKSKLLLSLFLSWLFLLAAGQTRNLDFYITEGFNNSPLLNDFRNQVSSAIADSALIRASKKPFVEARSFLQYSPYYKNFGYDEVITDGGNYMAVMGVSQDIFNRKTMENKYQAVDVQKQLIQNESVISQAELKRVITGQYLSAWAVYNDYLFNISFNELLKKEYGIVREFASNGIYKQTDYLTLLVEAQTQEILVTQLKIQYRKEIMLLNQMCGISDTIWYELGAPDIKITGTPDITMAPSYLQYKIDSMRIENEKSAIDLKYLPKVNWFADAGILTSDPINFYRNFGYSAGLSLTIPVFDGNQRDIEKQKLELSELTRKRYENNFKLRYFQQINQMNDELQSLDIMSVRMKEQLVTTTHLAEVLKDQLETGIIQMTEYINVIKNLKMFNRNLNMLNIQKLMVINDINFLLRQ